MSKRKKRDQLPEGTAAAEGTGTVGAVVEAGPVEEAPVADAEIEVIGAGKSEMVVEEKPATVTVEPEKAEVAVPVVAPPQAKIDPPAAEPTFSLEAAAPRLIYDYREGWAPAIRIRARMAGMDPDKEHTLKAWKEIFIQWGGHGMVR